MTIWGMSNIRVGLRCIAMLSTNFIVSTVHSYKYVYVGTNMIVAVYHTVQSNSAGDFLKWHSRIVSYEQLFRLF